MDSEEGDSEQARRSRDRGEGSGVALTEEIVPVFGRGTQSLDGGMKLAHALSHGVSDGIGVKAAVDGQALGDERAEPGRIRSGA